MISEAMLSFTQDVESLKMVCNLGTNNMFKDFTCCANERDKPPVVAKVISVSFLKDWCNICPFPFLWNNSEIKRPLK